MNKNITELSEQLLDYPQAIAELQIEILDKTQASAKVNDQISSIESKIKAEINSAVDVNGKKIFSNAEAREAELVERTSFDSNLASLRQENEAIQREIQEARIKVETMSSQQRNLRSLLHFFANSSELSDQI